MPEEQRLEAIRIAAAFYVGMNEALVLIRYRDS